MTARSRIASTIASHTLSKGGSKAYTKEIAAFLLSEGRVGELDSLLRDVQANWARQGYVEVIARSAFSLPAETKTRITAQLKTVYPDANTIVITEVIDPMVIGGVQLELADKRLDLSVEAKLNKFKQLTRAGKE